MPTNGAEINGTEPPGALGVGVCWRVSAALPAAAVSASTASSYTARLASLPGAAASSP
jgi:hypothetical protein